MEGNGGGIENSPNNEKAEQAAALSSLFTEYGNLAVLHGKIDESPADPSLQPGDDGTIDQTGERKRRFEYILGHRELPASVRERDVTEVKITYSPSVILEGEPTDEMVSIAMHEYSGSTKTIFLKRKDEQVSADTHIETDQSEQANLAHSKLAEPVDGISQEDSTLLRNVLPSLKRSKQNT